MAVTGLGMVTPAGTGTGATWAGVCEGVPRAATDPVLRGLPVDFSCAVPEWDGDRALGRRLARRLDRAAQMAVVAAREAVADAGLGAELWDPVRVAVVIGSGSASFENLTPLYERLFAGQPELVSPIVLPRSLPNSGAVEVALDLGARGPAFAPAAACATGAVAVGLGLHLLRADACDIVLAGGTESGRVPAVAASFAQMGALSRRTRDPGGASRPFDADRDGFVLGEGCGVLVLERLEHARARRAPVRALLAGYGLATEAYHVTAPHPEGRGLRQALEAALADAGWEPGDVDHVNAHGTATRLNDLTEARALAAVLPQVPPTTAAKGVLGHCLGAAGAIEAGLTVLALHHQSVPPTANLDRLDPDIDLDVVTKSCRALRMRTAVSDSVAFGGHNAVLAFEAVPGACAPTARTSV
ncbi:beta-ketoacyl-[acyl-carrier-protein] synthase family protein [Streptomyces gamaensis]|uniref:Beta-ketoacyl-[acyl-carrier-protein] synthase family protein n=1 Tax=Streptomyces gamaensis TaxID=1763542 RepID=A0ABW0YVX2_9ACTN